MNLVERRRNFAPGRDAPPPAPPVDRETFQRWVVNQERRYEWVEGKIIMMTEVSRDHSRIVTNLVVALAAILDRELYEIASSDFGVNTPLSRRFPDVLVEPASRDGKGRTSESPIFIAEVMSPSTVTVDRKKKPAEYATLASLQTYAVFSQDEPTVWVWQRSESGLPEKPTRLEGREARLDIPALGTSLPLADIDRGIGA
ncbi:MAG TPA: Uma2 family endonuclease [Beijerinckiaceae bacterium]|jgi:Uma2 family endonuclease|nr:Uma2 family endonuclease [Beijerinckiaceae bacterium]